MTDVESHDAERLEAEMAAQSGRLVPIARFFMYWFGTRSGEAISSARVALALGAVLAVVIGYTQR